MKLRLSNLSGSEPRLARLRSVWIVAPIVVGVGVALYLRQKKLAGRIGARTPSIATSNIRCVEKAPVSLDEWVSEPQIQPDVMPDFAEIPTSLPVATSEASEAKETRAAEFVIPTLIATSDK